MQKKPTETSHSKGIALLMSVEWGLRNIRFLSPHSFSAEKDGKVFCFDVCTSIHDDSFDVMLPAFDNEYLIMFIPNKSGDNCVLMTNNDCTEMMGKKVSMKWIADRIKRKWNVRTTQHIPHDG